MIFKHSMADALSSKATFGNNYERYCAYCAQYGTAISDTGESVWCTVEPVSREVYMSLVVNVQCMRQCRTTLNTMPEQAADIVRSLLSMDDAAWHTYDDEIVNMYITEDFTAVLSLRSGKLTIWEWVL